MPDHLQFYIDGSWVDPSGTATRDVVNPATVTTIGRVAMGDANDVDRAVAAARAAFPAFAATTPAERQELLRSVLAAYHARLEDLAEAVTAEMGAPLSLSRRAQVPMGMAHFSAAAATLDDMSFQEQVGRSLIRHEPIGVCALITPWNWPLNQITCKIAPALAAGCTFVLKPSEFTPLDAAILFEILHEAGVPAGVANLVQGDGPGVGAALASHPDVDMVSFTGSQRGGVAVATAAAPTVKRVTQELGGKSPSVVLEDADVARAAAHAMGRCTSNSGQSCNAPTRLLVPAALQDEAVASAVAAAEGQVVGDPTNEATTVGPVVNGNQWQRVQELIAAGIDGGATLATGGPGRPDGLDNGWFVRPTVFADVTNDMKIAREEVFGPVLAILPYDDVDDAIRMANDTPYGLAAYVWADGLDGARDVAGRIRAGQVVLNGAELDFEAPFGGYKQSGNGREWGRVGIEEYLETKAITEPANAPGP